MGGGGGASYFVSAQSVKTSVPESGLDSNLDFTRYFLSTPLNLSTVSSVISTASVLFSSGCSLELKLDD